MHRVMKRTWLIHVFLLILLLGMGFFLWEYATEAHQWVASVGSPHLYNNSTVGLLCQLACLNRDNTTIGECNLFLYGVVQLCFFHKKFNSSNINRPIKMSS